ncbi:MAG: gliding motility-associated C-terminal domain-containing protein, partial [Runella sp.]
GKKDSFLVVANRQGGTYSGSATFASTCPPTVASEVVNVFFVANPTVNITSTAPTGTLCQGGTVRLLASTTTSNPKFQWLHENKEIENASAAIFEASVSGIYIVKVTDPRGCVGISNALTVVTNTPPTAKITADARTMCPGQRLLLSATLTTGANYEWLKNGQPIANANQPNLTVNEAGSYKVRITSPNTCSTLSDPFEVRQVSAPVVQITAPSQQICQNSSLVLTANSTTSQTYQWYRNGQALSGATQKIYETREVGNFTVAVTDSNRCQNTSAAFEVSEIPSIRVTLDSIPLFCGTNAPPISLKGNPAGGIFSGKGVSNSIFDPQVASVGQHVITYTIQGANPCMSGTARRMAIVVDVPILELGENKKIMLGKTVQLNGDLGGNYRYQWTPATALSDPQMATPTALPEQTTTYHLRAVDANGCTVTDSITIFVLQGIYIPDVFTPNGDGINDTWEIKGLEAYPEAQLVIFDRWGIPVFHADRLQIQKFDGTYQGQPLPEGSYAFVLRTSSDEHIYRGNLMLMR